MRKGEGGRRIIDEEEPLQLGKKAKFFVTNQ